MRMSTVICLLIGVAIGYFLLPMAVGMVRGRAG